MKGKSHANNMKSPDNTDMSHVFTLLFRNFISLKRKKFLNKNKQTAVIDSTFMKRSPSEAFMDDDAKTCGSK